MSERQTANSSRSLASSSTYQRPIKLSRSVRSKYESSGDSPSSKRCMNFQPFFLAERNLPSSYYYPTSTHQPRNPISYNAPHPPLHSFLFIPFSRFALFHLPLHIHPISKSPKSPPKLTSFTIALHTKHQWKPLSISSLNKFNGDEKRFQGWGARFMLKDEKGWDVNVVCFGSIWE